MSTDPAPPDPLKRAKRAPLIARNSLPHGSVQLVNKSLDSSLKRHLSLLNRLRKNFSLDSRDAVLKDVEGLTLTKYADELVDACLEGVVGLGGKGDVFVVAEILSALAIRLDPSSFLTPLLTSLLALLTPPNASALKALPADQRDRDEKERVTKQRGVLRVLAEAEVCGLRLLGGAGAATAAAAGGSSKKAKAATPEDGSSSGWCVEEGLKGLLASDPLYTSLPLFQSFLKAFGRVYLGPAPPAPSDASADPKPGETIELEEDELVPADTQKRLRSAFLAYYEALGKVVLKGRVKLQEQDQKNHEAYIKSGEIFEDRQQAYEKMTKEVERLMAGMTSLADLLHLPAPVFPALTTTKGNASVLVLDSSTSANTFSRALDDIPLGGMWEDEEERRFYEDVVDLGEFVPGGILGVKEKKKEEDKEEVKARERKEQEEVKRELEKLEGEGESAAIGGEDHVADNAEYRQDTLPSSPKEEPAIFPNSPVPESATQATPSGADDADLAGGLPAGPLARLNAIFAALPETTSKAALDQLAVDFGFLNSKASRKRVIKFLGAVPKNRSDLLPLYARFTAILNPYMPDVGQGLIAILDEEFRYLQRKKLVKELAEVRSKNIRFYCELAKFKVAQPHTILHVYKVLIDDLTNANVECAALLLEGCGRFLLRSEETGERMKSMLELMRRKQSAQHFDQRLLLLLENAYYQCNPPERSAVQQKERPPMEQFVRHLIHDILIKKTVDKVLKLIRKLHWEDPDILHLLHKTFTKVWKIKFSNIGALAILVFEVARFHSDFAVGVVDQVIEDIRTGLETNIFKHNQRRIATIKFLGELHWYRQINSAVIFDTLWSLITFGHSETLPVPGRTCSVDAADDFFRVRLICTLLDTCGMCFDKGSAKKKLDQFLVIFQLYVFCKKDPPMDVEFMILDTLDAIRPSMKPFRSFEEVSIAVDDLFASQALQTVVVEDEESDREDGEDGEDGEDMDSGDERREDGVHGMHGDGTDVEIAVDEGDDSAGEDSMSSDDEEDDLVLQRLAKAEALSREEEDEFNREFSKMLVEPSESKKGDRKANVPIFDTAVPLIRKAKAPAKDDGSLLAENGGGAGEANDGTSGGQMKFMLLTKKGNKPQTKEMEIPADSAIAISSRSNQMLDKLDRQQMKTLVLNQTGRQEDNEKKALEALAKARGIRLRFVDNS